MAEATESTQDIWSSVLTQLSSDDRITPQLHGFISLVEPKGVMAGTLYLEVPNELTRGMLEQRIRLPLLSAISTLDESFEVATFAIVVNPEIQPDPLEYAETTDEQPYIETTVVSAALEQSSTSRKSDTRLNSK
jgi:chromosomal replication initiator protein